MHPHPPVIQPGETLSWLWSGSEFTRGAALPVTDRGFRYGMSLFESLPVRGGVGILLERHLARLEEACAAAEFSIPPGALEACPGPLREAEEGFARIYVTAGDGTVTSPCDACRVLVMVEPREPPAGRVYHRGYDVALHPGAHIPLFPGLKTGNYWAHLRIFREGVAAHCNETLLFTPAGHLISACMANVFIARGGRLLTPDHTTGARLGVTREWVMRHADVTETLISRAEIGGADEIFLTSSWLGIMPVSSIDGRSVASREFSAPLLSAWRKETHASAE